jgi:hypothetical protein
MLLGVLLLAVLTAPAMARPFPADEPASRLSGSLAVAARLAESGAFDRLFREAPRFAAGARVVVEADPPLSPAALASVGATLEVAVPGRQQVLLPVTALTTLAALPDVRHVREPAFASPRAVESEGWASVGTAPWVDAGWTGAGVHVAVVDVGFGGYEDLGDELPDDLTVDFALGAAGASQHGAAVAEVITDVAPGVSMQLTTFATEVELTAVLTALLDTDVQVVNASVGFDNAWSADGTSDMSRAVDALADAGVIVTVAAGNEAQKYRVGELRAVGDGQVLLAGDTAVLATARGGRARVSLRWEEPFGAATTDLDLVLKNADDGEECGRSEAPQDGDDDPLESVDASGCSEQVLALIRANGPIPAGLRGWVYSRDGLDAVSRNAGPSLSLPGDARGAFTVGAWVPEVGEVAPYSSRGPTEDGRTKPDVVGPSDVSTVSWGSGAFSGSSAATPHAAGLAALWLEAAGPDADPAGFRSWARDQAVDGGVAGPDREWGWGALAAGPPPEGCGCGGSRAGGGAAVACALAALYKRKRA